MSQASSDSRIIKQQAFAIQRQCAKLSETCPDAKICFLFMTEGKFYSFQTPNAWPIRATDIAGAALEEPKMPLDAASLWDFTDVQADQSHISCSGVPRPDSPTLGNASAAKHVYGPGGIDILSPDEEDSSALRPLHRGHNISRTRKRRTAPTISVPEADIEHSPESSIPKEQRRPLSESRGHGSQVISGSERHHYVLNSRPW